MKIASIAVNLHLGGIGESSLTDERLRNLIYSGGRHAYLCPVALAQNAVGSVTLGMRDGVCSSCGRSLRLTTEHEAGEHLILAVAENHGAERRIERRTLAVVRYRSMQTWHLAGLQGVMTKIVGGFLRSHVPELGIHNADHIR